MQLVKFELLEMKKTIVDKFKTFQEAGDRIKQRAITTVLPTL